MPKPERPRIAIIGGCQVHGLAAATKLLVPDAVVSAWHVGLSPDIDDVDLFKKLDEFDLIISQVNMYAGHERLDITVLRQAKYPVVYLPTIAFTGFHPDCSYIFCENGVLKGYFSDYHSNIIISSYILNLSEDRTSKLFNRFIFSHLGYDQDFVFAKSAFIENFSKEGYEIEDYFDKWMRDIGDFMYTMNHPHIEVMADLCALALEKSEFAGRWSDRTKLDDYLGREFVWPVYPGISSQLDRRRSTTFKRSTHDTPPNGKREIPIEEFIAGSYNLYSNVNIKEMISQETAVFIDKLAERVV